MMKSLWPSVVFMLLLVGTTFAREIADPAHPSQPAKKNIDLRARLDKDELIEHLCQVIMILQFMPESARKLLSLDKMELNAEDRINLRPVAQADLKAGRVNFLLAGGLAHPATGAFQKRIHEKYGVNYLEFGLGCTTEPLIRKSVEEHNALVKEFLHKKYPKYDVDEEKEWEASVAEQEKNITSPTPHTR